MTGFADEAAIDIDRQIEATKALGWKNIEMRKVNGNLMADIPEKEFNEICEKLDSAGIHINCNGSGVANWQKKITDPPESSYEEMKRAIPRMHRLGTKLIRVMSFNVNDVDATLENTALAEEVIKRMKVIVKMAEDGGVTAVHENCANWGGRSYEHTLRLLDAIDSPALKLVFDTGNPVWSKDMRGPQPWKYQNSFEFYSKVKEHVEYVHIKDAVMEGDKPRVTFGGEGDGCVREILTDLYSRGYNGGISIEPHLKVVFHDKSVTSDEQDKFDTYVEYGRRMEKMVREIGWKPE
jgi:sugar phosphate isomerase/epimerase